MAAQQAANYDDSGRKMEIARRIRDTRMKRRITQTELAKRLGCSRVKLNRAEHGQAVLTALEIDRLAQVLGVPVEHFFAAGDTR